MFYFQGGSMMIYDDAFIVELVEMVCGDKLSLAEADKLKKYLYRKMLSSIKPDAVELTKKNIAPVTEKWCKMRQNAGTNQLCATLVIDEKYFAIDLMGNATYINESGFELKISNFAYLERRTTANMLIDALVVRLTDINKKNVSISLDDYMLLRGLKDKKNARKQVIRDIKTISNVSFSFRKRVKNHYEVINLVIADNIGIKNNIIYCDFNNLFYDSLHVKQYMYFPLSLFLINVKLNPHSFNFGRKIATHIRTNIGKPNERIISVLTLISASPNFPKHEDLNWKHVTQQIIEPFERDMDIIKDFGWSYCGVGGVQIDQPVSYQQFITSNIKITSNNYPEISHIAEKRKKMQTKHNEKER